MKKLGIIEPPGATDLRQNTANNILLQIACIKSLHLRRGSVYEIVRDLITHVSLYVVCEVLKILIRKRALVKNAHRASTS